MQKDEIDICVITETKFHTDKENMKQSLQEAFGNEGDMLLNGLTNQPTKHFCVASGTPLTKRGLALFYCKSGAVVSA